MMEQIFNETDLRMSNDYDQEIYCKTNDVPALTMIDCIAMWVERETWSKHAEKLLFSSNRIIVVSVVGATVASTAHDVQQRTKNCKPSCYHYKIETFSLVETNQLLISFSLYTNIRSVFDTQHRGSEKTIKYLSGIKALSYFGIILLHSYTCRIHFPLRDPQTVESLLESSIFVFVSRMSLFVDTFLLISGLLITRTILRERDK